MHAVELPPRTVELELGPRRHRRITGPAGLLLFGCVFHSELAAIPLLWPPHIYGLLLALAASAQTQRGLRRAVDAMRAITILLVALLSLVGLVMAPLGLIAPCPALLVLTAIGFTGRSERRAAATSIAIGVLGVVWFGLMLDELAPMVASAGLLVGGLWWLHEAAPEVALPQAVGYPRERGTHEVHHLRRARAGGRRLRLQG
jgi:hypothetical protein